MSQTDQLITRRSSIGFGVERLARAAVNRPMLFWGILLVIIIAALTVMPRLKFDSNLIRMYEGSGAQYENFADVRQKFGMFETDLFIFVRSPDLTEPERLEAARLISEELAITPHIATVLSPFILRLPQEDGTTTPAFPLGLDTKEQVAQAYDTLDASLPLANNLINPERTQMTMVVMPLVSENSTSADTYAAIVDALSYLDLSSVEVEIGGQPVWMNNLLNMAGGDQIMLNLVGMVIAIVLALMVFRHPLLALMVIIAPVTIAMWALAITVQLFGSITFFTMVLATLMMMLSFAESIYFVRTWQNQKRGGLTGKDAVLATIEIVSPATVLSMATTTIAFLSLYFAPGRGIEEFAIGGAVGTMMAMFGLLTLLPLLLLAVDKYLPATLFRPSKPNMALQNFLTTMITRFARPVALGGVILVVMLLAPYAHIKPTFTIQQLIPESLLDNQPGVGNGDTGVGGIAPVYVSIKLDEDTDNVSREEFEQIQLVGQLMEEEIGAGQVLSLAQFGDFGSPESIRQMLDNLGPDLSNRFITPDGTEALMTGFADPNNTSTELKEKLANLSARMAEEGIDASLPTGFRVLTTYESENLIDQMEVSLFTAIVLTVLLIGLAFREFRILALSIVPNLFPVLAVVAFQYFTGIGQTMTSVIALTIAFGVAVNDTIHLLNTYRHYRQTMPQLPAIREAITHVGKAMLTTTAILCAGVVATLFSAMPQINEFGELFIGAMLFALLGDLIFLPAIIAASKRS